MLENMLTPSQGEGQIRRTENDRAINGHLLGVHPKQLFELFSGDAA